MSMVHIVWDNLSFTDAFAFKFAANPCLKFSFDRPSPRNRPLKRRRALSDVDGDGNERRKKRRLRLLLVTSRLSRPFSQPASNIVSRGSNKIPVRGGKNKALSRNGLRKAAIMNRVRRRMDAARDFMRMEQEKTKERLSLGEIAIQKLRCHGLPLQPSPLGLSNYDALDSEDEDLDCEDEDEEWHSGGGLDRISTIYSDFNFMRPMTDDHDDDDLDEYLDALDGISSQDLPDTPPAPADEECIVDILREDCPGESFFVQIKD